MAEREWDPPAEDAYGRFWPRDTKGNKNWPSFTGTMEFSQKFLRHLVDLAKAGKPIEADFAGWKKEDKDGGMYVSFKIGEKRERKPKAEAEKQDFSDFDTGGGKKDDDLNDDVPF